MTVNVLPNFLVAGCHGLEDWTLSGVNPRPGDGHLLPSPESSYHNVDVAYALLALEVAKTRRRVGRERAPRLAASNDLDANLGALGQAVQAYGDIARAVQPARRARWWRNWRTWG